MSKIERIGDWPSNSRIKITYPKEKGKEPEIQFEYPDNERQMKDLWKTGSVRIIALSWTVLTIVILLLIFFDYYVDTNLNNFNCVINGVGDYYQPIETEKITNISYNFSTVMTYNLSTILAVCAKDNTVKAWAIRPYFHPLALSIFWNSEELSKNHNVINILLIGLFICFLYIFGLIFYSKLVAYIIIKTRAGKKYFPGFNKKLRNKNFLAEFKECPINNTIEIPLFSNIYMDYEAEGEFSDYMESFEIKEHDFKYIRRKRSGEEIIPNVSLWKAIFKFRKNPKKGFLQVRFT